MKQGGKTFRAWMESMRKLVGDIVKAGGQAPPDEDYVAKYIDRKMVSNHHALDEVLRMSAISEIELNRSQLENLYLRWELRAEQGLVPGKKPGGGAQTQNNESAKQTKGKFKGKCTYCGIKGHKEADCFKKKAAQSGGGSGHSSGRSGGRGQSRGSGGRSSGGRGRGGGGTQTYSSYSERLYGIYELEMAPPRVAGAGCPSAS
mgnify:CR=1 FL=1